MFGQRAGLRFGMRTVNAWISIYSKCDFGVGAISVQK